MKQISTVNIINKNSYRVRNIIALYTLRLRRGVLAHPGTRHQALGTFA